MTASLEGLPRVSRAQVFQAYMLNRTGQDSSNSSGSGQWEMPEDLLSCSHEAWLRSTKKIK